jgi:hypothetical protein
MYVHVYVYIYLIRLVTIIFTFVFSIIVKSYFPWCCFFFRTCFALLRQFNEENFLRWDSLGEFFALAASFEHLAQVMDKLFCLYKGKRESDIDMNKSKYI